MYEDYSRCPVHTDIYEVYGGYSMHTDICGECTVDFGDHEKVFESRGEAMWYIDHIWLFDEYEDKDEGIEED